ncbi:MAG: TIGR02266 family protein [Myxococcota bacterium]|nr:TIGR02266 family protein [Myxococcota bacterium]
MTKVSIETEGSSSGADRRRFERAEVVVQIEYSTVDDLFSEFTRDINEGGLFIETEDPLALGTTVDLQFLLPGSSDPIKAAAEIVRLSDGSGGEPVGMAVEFDSLPADARKRINELIRSMRSRS